MVTIKKNVNKHSLYLYVNDVCVCHLDTAKIIKLISNHKLKVIINGKRITTYEII